MTGSFISEYLLPLGPLLDVEFNRIGSLPWDWYSAEWLHLFSFQGLYEGLQPGFRE